MRRLVRGRMRLGCAIRLPPEPAVGSQKHRLAHSRDMVITVFGIDSPARKEQRASLSTLVIDLIDCRYAAKPPLNRQRLVNLDRLFCVEQLPPSDAIFWL